MTRVKGEAADILRSVQASQGNFQQAWKLLDDYYSNDKRLVAMFIESILDQPSLKSSSLSQLKKLIAGVNFSLNSLEQLGRATKQWDDLLVTIIARKFDVETRREWDKKSCTLKEIPTMKDLTDFINVRITILERFEASSSRKDVKQEISRSSRHTNHVSQVVNKVNCRLCSMDTHNTHMCQEFKSKSVDERYNIVKEKRLCFNCLGSHSRDRCPSKSRCRECNQKHHTLLHRNLEKPTSVNVVASDSASSMSQDSMFSKHTSHNVHVTSASTHLKNEVLIPTALIDVTGADGKLHKVRAMIDQGSQSSFVSQILLQKLKLPWKKSDSKIYGVCNSQGVNVKGETTLVMSSRHNSNVRLKVNVDVLHFITKYQPISYQLPVSWNHLEGLQLADTFENPLNEIDVLLGGDVIADILQEGFKPGISGTPIAQNTIFGWTLSGAIFSDR